MAHKAVKKINELLVGETQVNALDFADFLDSNKIPTRLYVMSIVGEGGNFPHIRPWVIFFNDCDISGDVSADDDLIQFAHSHAHICDHFITNGQRCGNQPGKTRTIFGKEFDNICRCPMQFINPDADTLGNMKKLLLLLKESAKK